jgi:hypothetical protein
VEDNRWYYKHIQEPVDKIQDNQVTTLWNRQTVAEPVHATNVTSNCEAEKEHVSWLMFLNRAMKLYWNKNIYWQRDRTCGTRKWIWTSSNRCDWKLIKINSGVFRKHRWLTLHRAARGGHAWNSRGLEERYFRSAWFNFKHIFPEDVLLWFMDGIKVMWCKNMIAAAKWRDSSWKPLFTKLKN